MNLKKITSALLLAGMVTAASAADGEFGLKGNVQTQATKMIADRDNNLSSLWIRANIGGNYKSENFDALVMLRIFAPQFGNKIKDGDGKTTSYDKILADLYWANYKWNFETFKLNLKIGHWKTDWSQSTHFGPAPTTEMQKFSSFPLQHTTAHQKLSRSTLKIHSKNFRDLQKISTP